MQKDPLPFVPQITRTDILKAIGLAVFAVLVAAFWVITGKGGLSWMGIPTEDTNPFEVALAKSFVRNERKVSELEDIISRWEESEEYRPQWEMIFVDKMYQGDEYRFTSDNWRIVRDETTETVTVTVDKHTYVIKEEGTALIVSRSKE